MTKYFIPGQIEVTKEEYIHSLRKAIEGVDISYFTRYVPFELKQEF